MARHRGVAAVLELITVTILARSLSPANFGQIVLIQTYVLIVRGWAELRHHVTGSVLRGPSLKSWHDDYPGLRAFLTAVYLQTNMRSVLVAWSPAVSAMLRGKAKK